MQKCEIGCWQVPQVTERDLYRRLAVRGAVRKALPPPVIPQAFEAAAVR